jgi:hypothetical protein
VPVNPALVKHAEERRKRLENRIADQITRFREPDDMQVDELHGAGEARSSIRNAMGDDQE